MGVKNPNYLVLRAYARNKTYRIAKRPVLTAYERVTANKEMYGRDEQSIEDLEKDLNNNILSY